MPWIAKDHRHSDTSYELQEVPGGWCVLAAWWCIDRHGNKEETTSWACETFTDKAAAQAMLAKLQER